MTVKNSRLISAREKLGISQVEAAKGIGITPGMYAMLETGDRKGSDQTKVKVSNFFDLPVGYLFFGVDITHSENKTEQEAAK